MTLSAETQTPRAVNNNIALKMNAIVIFQFINSFISQKENGMDLKDRMAFACRYLSDSKVRI